MMANLTWLKGTSSPETMLFPMKQKGPTPVIFVSSFHSNPVINQQT
jgi:hypothetical protein